MVVKRFYLAVGAGILALFGLAYWKNNISYRHKRVRWRIGKSVVDCSLVVLSAVYLPALLVSWSVMWLTRPLKQRGVQMTIAVILGVVFGTISGVALEILCLLGIVSVDLVTGEQGLYGWWRNGPPNSFMPFLVEKKNVNSGI